jgi:hypothetical protein
MTFVRGLSHPVSLSAIFVPKGNPLVELLSRARVVAESSSDWIQP